MRKELIILLFPFYGFCALTLPGCGARAQGLGNAFIGLSNNIYAIITNPAGLSLITSYETSFSYTTDDDKYDFSGISIPEKMKGNLGIAVLRKKDKAFYFSYGRKIKGILSGASIKLFKNGLGLDLGILYPYKDITSGFVLGNILRKDFGYGFGLSARLKKGFIFAADIKKRKTPSLNFGIEKRIKGFFIRAGIDDKRLSLGFSCNVSEIDIDFSISPLSFSFTF